MFGGHLMKNMHGAKKNGRVKMYLKWKCRTCKQTVFSNSNRRHTMDFCECGVSGIDLEQDYMRVQGFPGKVEEYDYNFFDELVICMIKQGFRDGIFKDEDGIWLDIETVLTLQDLEDKIIGGLE